MSKMKIGLVVLAVSVLAVLAVVLMRDQRPAADTQPDRSTVPASRLIRSQEPSAVRRPDDGTLSGNAEGAAASGSKAVQIRFYLEFEYRKSRTIKGDAKDRFESVIKCKFSHQTSSFPLPKLATKSLFILICFGSRHCRNKARHCRGPELPRLKPGTAAICSDR